MYKCTPLHNAGPRTPCAAPAGLLGHCLQLIQGARIAIPTISTGAIATPYVAQTVVNKAMYAMPAAMATDSYFSTTWIPLAHHLGLRY